jgi:hypothetical protein
MSSDCDFSASECKGCRRRLLQARKRQKKSDTSNKTAISPVLPRFAPLPRSKQIRPAVFLTGDDQASGFVDFEPVNGRVAGIDGQ